ncbi:GNAT superfamily N-acetyltransferase [Azospirillum fermentarium]|uniref:GNAT family N-acetyltransferase n=1 Tax=Azospirillum fermentarium TaxID=1233114 RepID=UPI00222775AC|nr:GNAT family N-acetyltransferase [Azospirillum fermentarium]MCW2247471.1 GNAT superfamily N-acetyltransferase [Azospirillum fermentarium]
MTALPWNQRGIARYQPADRTALRDFQRAHFGTDTLQCCDAHFPWLFEQVPAIDAEGPHLWLCRRGDTIVGQQAGIPFRLKAGDRRLTASWAIDLMVAPEWRLRGVGPALTEAQANATDLAISLAMSDAAYKSYKRAGWIDLGGLATHLRVIDAAGVARAAGHGGGWKGPAAAASRPLLAAAGMACAAAAWAAGFRLEPMACFDERADGLWRDASPSLTAAAERSADFLRWRFDAKPDAGKLRRLALMRGGRMAGYVVLRTDLWRGLPVGAVMDYLTLPGGRWPLFALLAERARRDGLAALSVRALDARLRKPLRSLGFVCFPNGISKPTRMMIRPAASLNGLADGPGDADTVALLSVPARWFVTAADSDIGFKPTVG